MTLLRGSLYSRVIIVLDGIGYGGEVVCVFHKSRTTEDSMGVSAFTTKCLHRAKASSQVHCPVGIAQADVRRGDMAWR